MHSNERRVDMLVELADGVIHTFFACTAVLQLTAAQVG
jgi:hypothetical protein